MEPTHTTPAPPDIHGMIAAMRQRQDANEAAGIPALKRLVEVAQRNSGQPRHVRRFLLACYNGSAWPLDLTRLRSLDVEIQEDVLAVLRMDMCLRNEVHTYIDGGDELWQQWWWREKEFDSEDPADG